MHRDFFPFENRVDANGDVLLWVLPFPKGVHAIDAHEGDLISIEVCQAYLVKRAQDALVQDVQKYHA